MKRSEVATTIRRLSASIQPAAYSRTWRIISLSVLINLAWRAGETRIKNAEETDNQTDSDFKDLIIEAVIALYDSKKGE